MIFSDKDELDIAEIRRKYNHKSEIWDPKDKWHSYTYHVIETYLQEFFEVHGFDPKDEILNAGSAGNDYGIRHCSHFHIDIAENKLKDRSHCLIADIESIPLESNRFSIGICVGSVINYCDAFKAISELHRLLMHEGFLILEFESSKSFEFYFQTSYNQSAVIVDTFYNGNGERLWVYSEKYITGILESYGLHIVNRKRFHIMSPLIYKLSKNESKASHFANLDKLASRIPIINKFSSNIILTCRKIF